MKDTTTSVAIVLFKSKTLASGEHPLMLRVTRNRKASYKSIGLACHPKYWNFEKNEVRKNHPDRELLETILATKLKEYRGRINDLKAQEKDFTSASLINKVESKIRRVTVYGFTKELIDRLILSKQIGNANTYKDALRSLKAFTKNKDLAFQEIDYPFLTKYEAYLRAGGLAETSLSVYFRTLRAIYNKAIMEKVARLQDYPFKEFKVSKFDTTTRKRAITKDQIKAIELTDLSEFCPEVAISRQYFLFSYYCSGINFIDMAKLTWQNVVLDRLIYKRSKTAKEFTIKLLPPALAILEQWRPITGGNSANYIFPILNKDRHIKPETIDNRATKIIGEVNKHLKLIGAKAKIETPLTTYVARHSFATVLKRTGVATAVISELLGHDTEATTQTYLKSFENDILDLATENLL